MNTFHIPVLLKEVMSFLDVKPDEKYIDATLGGGGHSSEIIKLGGIVLGIDQDIDAVETANVKFQMSNIQCQIVRGNFKDLRKIAAENSFEQVSGILFDLGVSSYQFDTAERGFSFSKDAALDMRMDRSLSVSAADLINGLNKQEMMELFEKLGEEMNARRIVPAILREREKKKIEMTKELAGIIEKVSPRRPGQIHPATKIFQALRIAVNDELNNLREALPQAADLLRPGGRLVIITFHSLEDRIVKHAFLRFEAQGLGSILNKKPIMSGEREVQMNPRSRSAKLRVFEKNTNASE